MKWHIAIGLMVGLLGCGASDYLLACEDRCSALETCQHKDPKSCVADCVNDFDDLESLSFACAQASLKTMKCLNPSILTCIPVIRDVDCRPQYAEAKRHCYEGVVSSVAAASDAEN